MPAARYWRIVGVRVHGGGDMELGALHLCDGVARMDRSAVVTCSHAPISGALSNLSDDDLMTVCRFSRASVAAPGFWLMWDFGAATADVWGLLIGSAQDESLFLSECVLQYFDGVRWRSSESGRYAWPGVGALTPVPSGPPVFELAIGIATLEGSDVRNWGGIAASADMVKMVAIAPDTVSYMRMSIDGGSTWANITGAGQLRWAAVDMSAGGELIAAAQFDGAIYTSGDGGTTWLQRTDAGVRSWVSVAVSGGGSKIFAVTQTYAAMSADAGATWIALAPPIGFNWRAISVSDDGNRVVIFGNSCIAVSFDGGSTWTNKSPSSSDWGCGAISADGFFIVAGSNPGYISTSADGGNSWVQRTAPGVKNWRSLSLSADGSRVFAGADINSGVSYVYSSEDFGANFSLRLQAASYFGFVVAASAAGNLALISIYQQKLRILVDRPPWFKPLLLSVRGAGSQLTASAYVPGHSTRRAARLQLARDVEHGGPGTIYGTTKTKGTPNQPAKARVVLLHQRSKLPVRETWSDPVTGNFAFTGIDTTQQFITLAEDAAGNFRPVAANLLTPEVLP